MNRFIIIKETHRGLWYEDGVLVRVLGAGRYKLPQWRLFRRKPIVEVVLVDMRARELTIKGQEILTSDKVAVRVNILVQFNVTDPKLAHQAVANYEDRLYSDVQLAARRSLAAMSLEEILTNRHRLSGDILQDVKETAAGYGVSITRADVKDLMFPGNLQEIMNKVLAAERTSQAQLVEARTRAEVQRIEAQTKSATAKMQAETEAESIRLKAKAEAEAISLKVAAERQAAEDRAQLAEVYGRHPVMLKLDELAALSAMAQNANARIYLNFPNKPDETSTSN
jgi:regulator of protease activity HflC (stomatin/prohibitin superfamily)